MIETERKFIILMPDTEEMAKMPGYGVSKITQTYLDSPTGVTERVRMREYKNRTEYTHTKKRRISPVSSIEDEREIGKGEYIALIGRRKSGTRPIKKTRYTLDYLSHTLEIDIYPEWEHHAIMECELESEDEKISLPRFITVVREVTGIKEYTNASMAREFPKE